MTTSRRWRLSRLLRLLLRRFSGEDAAEAAAASRQGAALLQQAGLAEDEAVAKAGSEGLPLQMPRNRR